MNEFISKLADEWYSNPIFRSPGLIIILVTIAVISYKYAHYKSAKIQEVELGNRN